MESIEEDLEILKKPEMDVKNLTYITGSQDVYVNLFQILMKKSLKTYLYNFTVEPELEKEDINMRSKLFSEAARKIKSIYGEYYLSPDSLYALKKINEIKKIETKIYFKGSTTYVITISQCREEIIIKQEDIYKTQLATTLLELLIKDILYSNPKLEFYKGFFVFKEEKTNIETDRVSIDFYPGYATSFVQIESGNFLCVSLKNKYLSTNSILDYLETKNLSNKNEQKEIKDYLVGKSFKVNYSKHHYFIEDILFDKSPKIQTINYNGRTVSLVDYYKMAHNFEITDLNQPLILVQKKGPQDTKKNLFFIPEFSYLTGLDDSTRQDHKFMNILSQYTKLDPTTRVEKINDFLNLFQDNSRKKEDYLSCKEKCEFYGIEIRPLNHLFKAFYMEEPILIAGGNKKIEIREKQFKLNKIQKFSPWLCFYQAKNYNDAEKLLSHLQRASKSFGLKVEDPEWVEMSDNASPDDWIYMAEDYLKSENYKFVLYLLGKKDYLFYPVLKRHSLCNNGYVSQVVKLKSLTKNALSICSKILIQINSKLNGIPYILDIDKRIKNQNIMVMGVNSSHVPGKRTAVAMVSTIDINFSNLFNKEELIIEKNKEQLQYCISSFIPEAVNRYKKNNGDEPNSIIIYRQGVAFYQKEYLKNEINQIKEICKTKNIRYYYILVNTKTKYKFFEKSGNKFYNPAAGLLVIDEINTRNYFEFFIQPQEVTGGSATPTCFHVAHGDMDLPELVPKLTYDLCHIYSNWQGPVRVPNVIKCAEKLSKMTAKYTKEELNENLKEGQSYL